MRISDWSSDVCSSDLPAVEPGRVHLLAPAGDAPTAQIIFGRSGDKTDAPVAKVDQVPGRKLRRSFVVHRQRDPRLAAERADPGKGNLHLAEQVEIGRAHV